jgi:glycosyltransferase involved in cell wall biosynthesis
VDLLVAPSQFLRSRYIEWGIPEEQIVYSDYGIDITPFGRLKRSDSPSIRFGFVGTVVYYKGVQVLIEAFNGLEEGHALLSVYGGGNNLKALKKAAKTPNIKFLGRFEPEDVGKIFSEIDILVVPSIWYENSPLVIHEAFASKVPVIASNAGGMAELVHHEVTGLLFETGSVDACYQAMKRMIDEPFLIEKFRENIPKIKTLQENATEIEKIYSKLVGGSLCDVL